MYLEAMQDILPGVKHVYVMEKGGQNVLPFLNLSDAGSPAGTQQSK